MTINISCSQNTSFIYEIQYTHCVDVDILTLLLSVNNIGSVELSSEMFTGDKGAEVVDCVYKGRGSEVV